MFARFQKTSLETPLLVSLHILSLSASGCMWHDQEICKRKQFSEEAVLTVPFKCVEAGQRRLDGEFCRCALCIEKQQVANWAAPSKQ